MQIHAVRCPDCHSNDLKKASKERITDRTSRSYYDCQQCHARIRILEEDKCVTDVTITAPNTSVVNLVLLAIDRMSRRDQQALKTELEQAGFI